MRSSSASRRLLTRLAWCACAAALAYAPGAHADEDEPTVPKETGTRAQRLFYEGRKLMKSGRYELACSKFEESLSLEYGIGTEFNLADCNEKLGRLSSAWSAFVHVATTARARAEADREQVARARAGALEPRVPKLVFDVPSSAPAGLAITRDGAPVEVASWGRPLPVDPGTYHVVASASGKRAWEAAIAVKEGAVVHVVVPDALGGPTEPEADPAERTASAALTTEPPADVRSSDGARVHRIAGWAIGGLGAVGLGVGLGFGLDSLRAGAASRAHCAGDRCNAEGVDLRARAIRSGDAATVATIAGVGVLAAGVVLVLTAPRDAARAGARIEAAPQLTAGGGGLVLQGTLQ